MSEWNDDPWIQFGNEIGEEFYSYHRETTPEDPHDVWDENEVTYFFFAFTLWAAQSKFKLKQGSIFNDRATEYSVNVKKLIECCVQNPIEGDDSEDLDYNIYKIREQEYVPLLMKGSSSIFSTISASQFKQALKSFLSHTCKRYIFSEKDLVKIINGWLIQKGMKFDKKIDFT